jgi:hypothetical protein
MPAPSPKTGGAQSSSGGARDPSGAAARSPRKPSAKVSSEGSHRHEALRSLEEAERLTRDGSTEQLLEFQLVRAQVQALLALEQRLGGETGSAGDVEVAGLSVAAGEAATGKVAAAKAATGRAAGAKAGIAEPTTAKSAAAKPATGKPATAKSAAAKPATGKPATAKAAPAKPATGRAATGKAAAAKAAAGKAAATKGASAKPAPAKPGPSPRRSRSASKPPAKRADAPESDTQAPPNGAAGPDQLKPFAELTTDRTVAAALDLGSSSSTVLVAFAGLPGHGAPPFEFFDVAHDLEVKKAYLRDLDHAWYHAGVRGFADSPNALVDKLREILKAADANRVVFVGSSAGGWAALMFGALLDVDLVLAFSPQTTLDEQELGGANDTRWDRWLSRARRQNLLLEDRLDLRQVLESNPPSEGRRRVIHYASTHELDRFHAERLAELPGIELVGHDEEQARGGMIRYLGMSERLGPILADAVADQPKDG